MSASPKDSRFPHLADALDARRPAILARTRETPLAGLNREEALRAVASMLRGDPAAPPVFTSDPVSTRDLLTGYHQLREAVIDEVAGALGRDLLFRETARLNAILDASMNEHVAAAVEHQLAEARATAEAQGKYMSFLSHDLRGSLNGIMLMLEVLRREMTAKGEATEAVEDILLMRRSILDAVAMMERHLQADRLRRGRIVPVVGAVPLMPLVKRIVAELPAESRAVPVRVDVPEHAAVKGDAELVRQTLHSLIDNAVRHGGAGVHVKAERDDSEWSIIVSDQGRGMNGEHLRQWLDPVRRMERKERGMGLQIAWHAARLMHGRLTGESEPGRGLTMRLVLPAATDGSSAARTDR